MYSYINIQKQAEAFTRVRKNHIKDVNTQLTIYCSYTMVV